MELPVFSAEQHRASHVQEGSSDMGSEIPVRRDDIGPRIAYVISSLEGGGAALPVPAVSRVLRNHGAQVKVFALTRRDGRALSAMLCDGLDVQVRTGGEHDHLAAMRWLDHALADYRPSLIWTSLTRATVIGLLLGWRRHIPVVSWQHNAHLKPHSVRLLRLLRQRPALWVCDSNRVAAVTAQQLRAEPERLFVWPLFAAQPDVPQAQAWQAGQKLRLGSLGRLHWNKGYDVLVAALALLGERGFHAPTPFEISIAGEGAERAAIEQAAKRAGFEHLHLPGYSEHPREFLAGLHLYLQPTRAEGLCIAVHEAMQAGLPVIASAVGQIPHSLEHGRSGWLVPPGDASALADALASALSDPARLAAMGRNARRRVLTQYSVASFHQAGEALLARLALPGLFPPASCIHGHSAH